MNKILSILLLLISTVINATGIITVNVPADATRFQVTLSENPTTGYQWTATRYDTNLLTLQSSNFIAKKTGMVGAGGQKIFNFKLVKGVTVPATSQLEFSLARAWEHKNVAVQKVTVRFQKPKKPQPVKAIP